MATSPKSRRTLPIAATQRTACADRLIFTPRTLSTKSKRSSINTAILTPVNAEHRIHTRRDAGSARRPSMEPATAVARAHRRGSRT